MVAKSSISQAIATARFFARKPFPTGTIKIECCPLCKGTVIQRDYLGGNTKWAACASCKSFFSESFPTDEEIKKFYRDDYREFEVPGGQYPLPSHRRTHVIRAARQIALLLRVIKDHNTALDYGCALGWSVHCMRFIGLEAYGVELGASDREWAKKYLGLTIYENVEDVPIQSFSLIFMSHVLEHFINPIEVLSDLVENHLDPGGRVLIEVPNYFAPSAWSAFHAVIFNTQSLSHTLQEAGLKLELVRSKETDSMYPANLIWAVARKPHESDADEYTKVGNPFTTTHAAAGPYLHPTQCEGGCDIDSLDEGGESTDGPYNPASEDIEGS